jgi:hypothetical protein
MNNIDLLTSPALLGKESGEDSMVIFNDFDDFNKITLEKSAGNTGRRYRTYFTVSYVNPVNVTASVNYRTYVKRMDLKTWRISPPLTSSSQADTLRMSTVMGYFWFQ